MITNLNITIIEDDEYYHNLIRLYVIRICKSLNINPVINSFYTSLVPDNFLKVHVDLFLVDFMLEKETNMYETGLELLMKIHHNNPLSKVVIISQESDWANFKSEFIKLGADTFYQKDNNLSDNIKNEIIEIIEHWS